MPFTPPSPDTLVDEAPPEQPQSRFTPPSPNAFVDESQSLDAATALETPSHIPVTGRRQMADAIPTEQPATEQPVFARDLLLPGSADSNLEPQGGFNKPVGDIVDSGIWSNPVLPIPAHKAPAKSIPGAVLHAVDDAAAGVVNYLQSPQGLTEGAVAATPAAPIVLVKWARDMVLGAKHSIEEIGSEITQMLTEGINRQFVAQNKLGQLPPVDPAVMQGHVQAIANNVVQAAVMGLGAAGVTAHAASSTAGMAKAAARSFEPPPAVKLAREIDAAPGFDPNAEDDARLGGEPIVENVPIAKPPAVAQVPVNAPANPVAPVPVRAAAPVDLRPAGEAVAEVAAPPEAKAQPVAEVKPPHLMTEAEFNRPGIIASEDGSGEHIEVPRVYPATLYDDGSVSVQNGHEPRAKKDTAYFDKQGFAYVSDQASLEGLFADNGSINNQGEIVGENGKDVHFASLRDLDEAMGDYHKAFQIRAKKDAAKQSPANPEPQRPAQPTDAPPEQSGQAVGPVATAPTVAQPAPPVNVPDLVARAVQLAKNATPEERAAVAKAIEPARKGDVEPLAALVAQLQAKAPPKTVARPVTAVRMFERETEAGGPDILSWINENGKLLSKTMAAKVWGKDKFALNKSLWDDSVPLQKPHHAQAIYGDKLASGPDTVAQAAYEAHQIKEPSAGALWQAIDAASKKRANVFDALNRQNKAFAAEVKEHEDWIKATKKGEVRVSAGQLGVGDFMEVNGEHVEVVNVDPDTGDVTLKDGKKFGVQKLPDGQSIHVEKFTPGQDNTDFLPPDEPTHTHFSVTIDGEPWGIFRNERQAKMAASGLDGKIEIKPVDLSKLVEPTPADIPADNIVPFPKAETPKLRPGEKGTGDLLQGGDAPFNLAGEKAVDAERIAKEKADAERIKKEAAELEKKQQGDLLGGDDLKQTAQKSDAFERARKGDESAFDDLDSQFREIYPDPEDLEFRGQPNPNQVHTPQAFAALFNKAFAARDFDSILDAIKATSDKTVWKPLLQKFFADQATDPIAAAKAEWFRHVFNGTRPADAIPRHAPKASAPPPPRPGPTPRPGPGAGPGPGPTPGGNRPPPGYTPPPPSPPPVRIPIEPISGGGAKSPYKIISDFSAAIGKAIRVMRMKRNTLGTYSPGSTLTAEKFAGDLDTAAHELAGHWVDDKYGIGKPWVAPRTRSPFDTELAKFWIHGSVTPTSTLRYRRAEGVAEFVRAYVVNPTVAKAEAPLFSAYFERTLPPNALKAIQEFSKDVRTWAGEDPLIRAGLNIRMEPPSLRERLVKGLQGRGFGFEINPIDRLRLWFDDSYHYAVKAFHEVQAVRGGRVLPQENFELLSRLLASHDARMGDQFESGLVPLRPRQVAGTGGRLEVQRLIDPVTQKPMSLPWLLDAFDKTDKAKLNRDMRDASAYMVAQRTIEKGAQLGREENVSGIGAGIMSDKQAAEELLRRVAADPAREARLKEAARRYRLWASKNIDMLVDAGRLTPEAAAEIRDKNQQYVDMHRLSEEFDAANFAQRGRAIGTLKDVIKRFKGSSLELDNVYSNLLEQTDAIQKEAHRNVVMNAFTDGLRNVRSLHGPDLKDFAQFGVKASAADRNTITVYKDGHAEHWQFAPEIRESLKGLGELGTHAFIDIAAMPSKFARYMIAHGPQFLARNVARDTFERSVTSRTGSKPWDILQGYTKADLSRYEVFGGGQFGNYIIDRHVWNRELKRVVADLTKDPTNIILNPFKLKHAWEHLSEKSEKLGRIAEFRRAFDHGKNTLGYDDYNAALYAAGEARGLLDFAKAGTVMRVINKLVPFSNARIRGLARATTSIRENPGTFAMRWGMAVLSPTLAVMLWNKRDKKTWDEYQQQPAYLKDFFWNFKVGPYWIRIPRPHELGVMAGGVERAINRMLGDKKALEGYYGSSANAVLPISNPTEGTGPLKTFLELQFNRDTFRDRDIVPAWEKDLKLELRKHTKYASPAGQGIAGAINATGLEVDPRQVDYLLGSYGGLGQIATSLGRKNEPLASTALKSTGYVVDPPGSNARDVQWVLDWAKLNGKVATSEIKAFQALRAKVFEAKNPEEKNAASDRLIARAIALRASIEQRPPVKRRPGK